MERRAFDLRWLAWIVAAVACGGCVTVLIPPAELADPVPIILLDHGYTPSLVVPVDDTADVLVRYAYGDWRWYAEGRQGALDFLRAMFFPSQGALGRRLLTGQPAVDQVYAGVAVEIADAYLLHVERIALREFVAHMDGLFEANLDSLLHSDRVDLTFVHHPHRYHMFHNSNQAAAGWLRMLGITVRGPAMFSNWRVVQSSPAKN